jgi:hypothetical protein
MFATQTELFPPLDFIDYSIGSTSKSTRRKAPPKRKTIALLQSNDRPSNAQNY